MSYTVLGGNGVVIKTKHKEKLRSIRNYGITAASTIWGWDWSKCSNSAGATYRGQTTGSISNVDIDEGKPRIFRRHLPGILCIWLVPWVYLL